MMSTRGRSVTLVAVVASAIVLAFLPLRSLYFHSDDFEWLAAAARVPTATWWRLPEDVNGHFRPAAELTWLVGYRSFGLTPLGFFALALIAHLVAAVAVAGAATSLGGSHAVGIVAGLVFAVNFAHRGAITWLSAAPDRWQGAWLAVALAAVLAGTRYRLLFVAACTAALLSKESALIAVAALLLVAPRWLRRDRVTLVILALVTVGLMVPHVAAFAVSRYAQERFAVGAHAARGWLSALSELLLPSANVVGGDWAFWVGAGSWVREAAGLALLVLVAAFASRLIGVATAARWLLAVAMTLLLPSMSRDGVESRWLYLPWVWLAPLVACAISAVADLLPARVRTSFVVALVSAHLLAHGTLLHFKMTRDAKRDAWVRGLIEGAVIQPPSLARVDRIEVQVPFGAELRGWPVGLALALEQPRLEIAIIDDRTSPTPGLPLLDATKTPSRWVRGAR